MRSAPPHCFDTLISSPLRARRHMMAFMPRRRYCLPPSYMICSALMPPRSQYATCARLLTLCSHYMLATDTRLVIISLIELLRLLISFAATFTPLATVLPCYIFVTIFAYGHFDFSRRHISATPSPLSLLPPPLRRPASRRRDAMILITAE